MGEQEDAIGQDQQSQALNENANNVSPDVPPSTIAEPTLEPSTIEGNQGQNVRVHKYF